MVQVETWDYPNRRYYLHFDTVSNGIDFAAAYLEERAYRASAGEDIRGQRPMLRGNGRIPKSAGRFTERFVTHLEGARPVPYDASHTITLLVEPISDDGSVSGVDIIDRSPLSPSVVVNAEVGYEQVEIITVPTGGALTATQDTWLSNLNSTLASPGIFSTAALANASVGSGAGSSAADIYTYFTSDDREDAFKATIDISAVALDSSVQSCLALLQADEKIRPNSYQKLQAGTTTVLLDKVVTDLGNDEYDITEAP
ncbi:MAG: hypothetical protein AAGA46_03345 [Cyanobacteria bacterium P01_F01_bin.13]